MISLSPQRQPIARPARLPAIERVTGRGREANGAVRAGHLAITELEARQPESLAVPAAGPVTQIQVAKCAAGNLSPTVSGSTGQPNCPMSAGHRGPSGRPAVSNPGRPRLGNDGPGGLSLHQEACHSD